MTDWTNLDWIKNQAEDLKKLETDFRNDKISAAEFYRAKNKIETQVLETWGTTGLDSLKNLLS